MTKNAISWFEIPAVDFMRAKSFYEKVFGLELSETQMGPLTMGIFPADMESGGVAGALVFGETYTPSETGTLIYLNAGHDLQPVLDRIPGSGGKIIVPKTLISEGMGYIAIFLDTEGNRIGLYSVT